VRGQGRQIADKHIRDQRRIPERHRPARKRGGIVAERERIIPGGIGPAAHHHRIDSERAREDIVIPTGDRRHIALALGEIAGAIDPVDLAGAGAIDLTVAELLIGQEAVDIAPGPLQSPASAHPVGPAVIIIARKHDGAVGEAGAESRRCRAPPVDRAFQSQIGRRTLADKHPGRERRKNRQHQRPAGGRTVQGGSGTDGNGRER